MSEINYDAVPFWSTKSGTIVAIFDFEIRLFDKARDFKTF